tara:strand:+ start:14092 stop:14520 length:429 start_codon:yes stop_codon:yes gene_type:complete
MEKKTTIVYDPNGIIDDISLSVGMLEALQDLLIHYLSECKDHKEVTETYKKINLVANGDKEVRFEGIQSHIYILVALIQNLRSLALDQGVAKKVEIEDAVHNKAKEAAHLFLQRDPNKANELNSKLKELHEVTKLFTSEQGH